MSEVPMHCRPVVLTYESLWKGDPPPLPPPRVRGFGVAFAERGGQKGGLTAASPQAGRLVPHTLLPRLRTTVGLIDRPTVQVYLDYKRTPPPPRTAIGAQAWFHCGVLRDGGFL